MAAEAGRVAALLAGDLPHTLVEHAEEAGVELLPYGGELGSTCTCDAWIDPCPHALAVMYQLAWLVEDDPFVLLHLRGLARDDLLARLHEPGRVAAHGRAGATRTSTSRPTRRCARAACSPSSRPRTSSLPRAEYRQPGANDLPLPASVLCHVEGDRFRQPGEPEGIRQPRETAYAPKLWTGGHERDGPAELSRCVVKANERVQTDGVDERETGHVDGETGAPLRQGVIELPSHLQRRVCVHLTCDSEVRLVLPQG